ncbi:unnamed protein product [Rhizophagus irregularis]|nr:unnamed protein product [Rhizophagus irregularis]
MRLNIIFQCWDAKAENRPTAKELFQILREYVEPVNSIDYLSSFQEPISSSVNPISERLDCELSELDLNQDDE